MSRTFVAATRGSLATALVLCLSASTAHVQAEDALDLSVRAGANGSNGCFEVEALRQRIAHYSATGAARANGLRLELYVEAADSAELSVYRGSELVARRRFDHLPAACSDRRDAVALSIAMALEGVMHQLESEDAQNASPSAIENTPFTSDAAAESSAAEAEAPAPASTNAATQKQRASLEPAIAKPQPTSDESETSGDPDRPPDSAQDVATVHETTSAGPSVALHLGGRWLAEALPAPVWTGALGAELAWGSRFAIDASAIASTTADSTLAGASARMRLTGGELLGCSALKFGNFAAQGCLGAVLAGCSASGEHYPVAFPSATVLWAASTARLSLRWPDERTVSFRLVTQTHVNIVRPELAVDGSTAQLAPAWLGASVGLDMLVALE